MVRAANARSGSAPLSGCAHHASLTGPACALLLFAGRPAPGGGHSLPGDAWLPAPVSLRRVFARVGHSASPQDDYGACARSRTWFSPHRRGRLSDRRQHAKTSRLRPPPPERRAYTRRNLLVALRRRSLPSVRHARSGARCPRRGEHQRGAGRVSAVVDHATPGFWNTIQCVRAVVPQRCPNSGFIVVNPSTVETGTRCSFHLKINVPSGASTRKHSANPWVSSSCHPGNNRPYFFAVQPLGPAKVCGGSKTTNAN